MTTDVARFRPFLAHCRTPRGALRRAIVGGTVWGIPLAAAFTAMSAWRCGFVCIDEALATAALATAVGVLTIGPIAAFGPVWKRTVPH